MVFRIAAEAFARFGIPIQKAARIGVAGYASAALPIAVLCRYHVFVYQRRRRFLIPVLPPGAAVDAAIGTGKGLIGQVPLPPV